MVGFILGSVLFLLKGVNRLFDFRDFSQLLVSSVMEEASAWLHSFSNYSIVRHIDIFEGLINVEAFGDSLLYDTALELQALLREECVRRIRLLGECEEGFGTVSR